MEQTHPYRILWQKNSDGSARVLRMYGDSPCVVVPSQIAGHSVAEIAPYCFAQSSHLPSGEILEEILTDNNSNFIKNLQELCGTAIEEVHLPDSVGKIGTCAFYNCKNLKILHIGTAIEDIGSDAFMNTISFHRAVLRCSPENKSGIRFILSQISSDMEVQFETERGIEAMLLYPDYYESYDEIAPAHLFGRNISGEGFRARQCFKDGKIDFGGYDAIFSQACVEESEVTLAKMALNRLRYPYGLNEKSKEEYQNYIREQIATISIRLTKQKELEILQFLCQEGLLGGIYLANCIQTAAETDWVEGAASLLQFQAVSAKERRKNRYEF